MDFDSWTVRRVDTLRVRRLLLGWVVGAISVTAAMAFIILSSKGTAAAEEEDEGPIEVSLAKEAEPPPPPPPPPPPSDKPKAAPKPHLASPMAVPDDKPAEKDPTPQQQVVEEEDDKPAAEPAIASAAPPPPPPPVVRAKPQVKKPIRLTEDMPKPVQLVSDTPRYPPEAKAAGIEGVVIVKYIIAEDGSVRDAKVLKGPPELEAACLESVRKWRFQPIIVDGAPVAVVRIARFPFHIR
jgi:TonB family protein